MLGINRKKLPICEQPKRIEEEQQYFLYPLAVVEDIAHFNSVITGYELEPAQTAEAHLVNNYTPDRVAFSIDGFCIPCNKPTQFHIDKHCGSIDLEHGKWLPNFRERLVCTDCQLNNRQRLIATLVKQEFVNTIPAYSKIYFMEQVTPIFTWAKLNCTNCEINGSEYLGYEYDPGQVINGVRHEDVTKLSFADNSLDLIISNDVFEHVPDPLQSFKECARVLKSGGKLISTFPFHNAATQSVTRASLNNGRIEHHLEPVFHGNPVSEEGSLVFTDFGWDVLDMIKNAGFFEVQLEIYSDVLLGHLGGGGQIVFRATAS
jgi:hypothetical protein